jgi:hypothetical protein
VCGAHWDRDARRRTAGRLAGLAVRRRPASRRAAERLSFDALHRDLLDERSWLDVVTGWVPDHGALFDRLLEIAPWRQRTRTMWDNEVLEPRLVAAWSAGEPLPSEVSS